MNLLRVSNFCRPSPSSSTDVAIEVTTKLAKNEKVENLHCCSVGWVTVDVLISLSCLEGSFSWLTFGSTKWLLRLFLLKENDEEQITDDDSIDYSRSHQVFIPPIIAINLSMKGGKCMGILTTTNEMPWKAQRIILKPFGHPACWPRLEPKSNTSRTDDGEFWLYPRTQTMVQGSSLLSVYDSACDRVCYYVVTAIIPEKDLGSSFDCFITSPSTTFQLDDSSILSDFDVPRLPCLQSQLNYYRLSEAEFQLPPHPNVSELTSAFDLLPTAPPSERIVHVIGTDGDHDLCLAIKTAAQHVGRTCWSLRGLAAFAHAEGQTVRTGSLVDQLAGLDAALDEIHRCRMEPCVLNLYDIDGELSSTDEPLSHDQQERIWAKLMRAVARTTLESVDDNQANSTVRRNSCPLIIVLATSVPLKPGPWMQNLVFPSIVLAKPNAVYTRFLLEDVSLDDASLELLYGRSAREIRKIRQEVVGIEDIEEARLVLKRECDAFDDKRRKQRSATVSQVRWEDVGGMAYVRDEIMDAIELPLKHPHLFPNGQGRRGILLYGPPGTGKTLVAKAVATECGLPFLSIKGPELLGSYVGESEANIRDVFQSARDAAEQNAPVAASILFFDELDSLAPKRGGVGDGGGVMERVVATLFAELDGDMASSSSKGRVFVLGATNRPDLLDPSLLRPGRLDRSVYLGIATDPEERARILAAQLHKLKLEGEALDISRKVVAKLPSRLTGADFSTIASGALLQAVERLCRQADAEQVTATLERGRDVELHEILEGWDVTRCTPTVLLDDILEAAKEVTPSVSQAELDRYERLKEQYSTNGTGLLEHDGDIFY